MATITASSDQVKKWESLREYGDIPKLIKKSRKSRKSVQNALETGKGSKTLIMVLEKFYSDREKKLQGLKVETDNN